MTQLGMTGQDNFWTPIEIYARVGVCGNDALNEKGTGDNNVLAASNILGGDILTGILLVGFIITISQFLQYIL